MRDLLAANGFADILTYTLTSRNAWPAFPTPTGATAGKLAPLWTTVSPHRWSR